MEREAGFEPATPGHDPVLYPTELLPLSKSRGDGIGRVRTSKSTRKTEREAR